MGIILNDKYLKKIYKLPNPVIKWLNSSDLFYTAPNRDKKSIEEFNIPDELEIGGIIGIGTNIEAITEIEDAFFENGNLKNVALPKRLQAIGKRVFKGCPLESVAIPKGVTSIGESAFEDCKNLFSVTIPESVQEIGDNAFSGCTSLEKVKIPETVQKIGNNAFNGVPLVYYNGNAEGRPWGAKDSISEEIIKQREEDEKARKEEEKKRIEEQARQKLENSKPKPVILNDEYIKCLYGYNDKNEITSLVIKSDYLYNQQKYKIIEIPPYYFQDSSLKYLTIESDCSLVIGKNAFKNSSLEEVNIEDGAINIKIGTFQDCSSLKFVKIPKSIEKIENFVFKNCTGLESIEIPDGIIEIGIGAFKNCTFLKEIIIPSSCKKINTDAFLGCSSLEKVIISDGVEEIGESVFEDCDKLKEITIPNSVKIIGDYAFLGIKKVYYNGDTDGRTWGADIVKTYQE